MTTFSPSLLPSHGKSLFPLRTGWGANIYILQRHFKKHFASNRKHGDEQEAVGDAQLPNEPTLDLDTQLRPSQIDKSWESREAREGMKFPALQSTSTNLTTTSARSGTESSRSKNPLGDR